MGAGPFDLRYFFALSYSSRCPTLRFALLIAFALIFAFAYTLLCLTLCIALLFALPYSLLCVFNLTKINPQILLHTTVPAGLEVREFQSIRK